jgi:hypothetical protein
MQLTLAGHLEQRRLKPRAASIEEQRQRARAVEAEASSEWCRLVLDP